MPFLGPRGRSRVARFRPEKRGRIASFPKESTLQKPWMDPLEGDSITVFWAEGLGIQL